MRKDDTGGLVKDEIGLNKGSPHGGEVLTTDWSYHGLATTRLLHPSEQDYTSPPPLRRIA